MTLALLPYSSLSLSEKDEAFQLMQTVFGMGFHLEDWAPIDWILRIFSEDRLVSHLTVTDRTFDIGGKPVRIGGIGGVATLPEYRGKGHASQALQTVAGFMLREMQVDFGLLFCGHKMEPFYHRFGWQRVDAPVYFNQPDRKLLDDGILMYLACVDPSWPAGVVDVGGFPW